MSFRVKFINQLEHASFTDDELFHTLISHAVLYLDISEKELAREFGTSRPTANRWINGVSAPHLFMRSHVFKWLANRAITNWP